MRASTFRTPGLYLRGLETEGLAPLLSAVTGFVGVAERGPLNLPQPLRNWGEFLEVFGGFVPYSNLPDSVLAFFLNGGEKCYVVRVADTKNRSEENIQDKCKRLVPLGKASNVLKDENDDETIRIKAINEGIWANRVEIEVCSKSSQDIDLTTLVESTEPNGKVIKVDCVYDFSRGEKIWITHRDKQFIKRLYEIDSATNSIDETNGSVTLTKKIQESFPKDSVVSGQGFRLSFIYRDKKETFDNLSMNPKHPNYFVGVINGEPNLASYIERQKRGHSILVDVEHAWDGTTSRSRFKPKSIADLQLTGGGDGFIFAERTLKDASGNDSIIVFAKEKGRKGNSVRVFVSEFKTRTALRVPLKGDNTKRKVAVDNIHIFAGDEKISLISCEDPNIKEEGLFITDLDEPEHMLTLDHGLANKYPVGSEVRAQDRFSITVKKDGVGDAIEAPFCNLSMDSGSSRYFKKIINEGYPEMEIKPSQYICVEEAAPNAKPPVGEIQLEGGKDPGEIGYRYYTGYHKEGSYFYPVGYEEEERIGLAALEKVGDVNLVAIPDLDLIEPEYENEEETRQEAKQADFMAAQKHLLFHCQKMGERFGLLDPMQGMKLTEITQWSLNFSDTRLSKFGAIYYPWLFCIIEGEKRIVPPCGFIAGLIAQTDRRDGINKAPANLKIKGVVEPETVIDQAAQDDLNPRGINCIRKFEDGAIRLWGARTLSPELKWLYINVRRTFLFVIKALSRNLLWAVFEPNDGSLWAKIESTLNTFFLTMVSKGMTASPRPEEAFYVKCNEETNTKEILEFGQVIAEVGVALSAPAEFIVITVKKTPESLSVIEEEV